MTIADPEADQYQYDDDNASVVSVGAEALRRLEAAQLLGSGEGPEDILFDLFSDHGVVHIEPFLAEIRKSGILEDDPRIKETMTAFSEYRIREKTASIPEEHFKQAISKNIVMLSKAFSSEFAVENFDEFSNKIYELYEECKSVTEGSNADYIPQLAKANSNNWGVAFCTVDGQRGSYGDTKVPFSVQSANKPLMYAIAATDLGPDYVHKYVGTEPSGRSFNEITLDSKKRPHNPMINAGAIITASLVNPGKPAADRFEYVWAKYKALTGNIGHVGFNNSVYLSEKNTAWRNFALAYFMKENGCFAEEVTDIHDALDLYFQACSMEFSAESLSVIAATLANGGICPLTEERLLSSDVVKNTLSIMFSCGMYDYSGQFAFKVGLPAKSAVSGAVILVVPGVCGFVTYAPPLDQCGNSVKGVEFCIKVANKLGYHNFDCCSEPAGGSESGGNKPNVVTVLFAAQKGDLSAFRRFSLQGVDLNQKDYDSRTAIHIAAAEGHIKLVKFLLERCRVDKNVEDRWGNTPATEAKRFGHDDVLRYLNTYQRKKSVCAPKISEQPLDLKALETSLPNIDYAQS